MILNQINIDDINKNAIVNKLRWGVSFVMLCMILVTLLLYTTTMPLYYILLVYVLGVASNALHTYFVKKQKVSINTLPLFLFFDMVHWAVVILMLGGVFNPLVSFLIIPVIFAAIYSSESVFISLLIFMIIEVSIILFATYTYIPVWHFNDVFAWYILKYDFSERQIEFFKDWSTIVITGGFIGIILYVIRNEAYKYSLAQRASSQAYQEYMRVAAIGTMAAAAVHELGTPLNTIHLISTEMAEDGQINEQYKDDVQILAQQTERCQNILKDLVKMNHTEGNQDMDVLGVSLLMEQIAFPYRKDKIKFKVNVNDNDGQKKYSIEWVNEWTYGIGNILQNAFQFANTRVTVSIDLRKNRLMISVIDDGKGFSKEILETVGEPYVSGRSSEKKGNHMGLGLFIAKSLIEQTGGMIEFSNSASGGACVTMICKY